MITASGSDALRGIQHSRTASLRTMVTWATALQRRNTSRWYCMGNCVGE
ncbi:MAG: hypothetical protein HY649_12330 [Acidobacteria bacterium]|nr:hypothetical protein [Acidobacteriota bacterium]